MKLRSLSFLMLIVILAGCGSAGAGAPTPYPTIVLGNGTPVAPPASNFPGGVRASGVLVPGRQAQIASASGGIITSLPVALGQTVKAGEVLVKLSGGEQAAAALEAAKFELLAAQQALSEIEENAATDKAQAQLRLALASDAFDEAKKHRSWKDYRVGSDDQVAVARANLLLAEDALKQAEDAYGGYVDDPVDNLNKAYALTALANARDARNRASANLNYLLSKPDAEDVAKADAELAVAQAEMEAAQRALETIGEGPNPQALALAEARLKNAEAQVAASQAVLDSLVIKAPFSGAVGKIDLEQGSWANPGQVILVLADLKGMRVKTTDLSERDVATVQVGQETLVLIEPLGVNVPGMVTEIASLPDVLGGDVVYQTIIRLESIPDDARAGMSVEVSYGQ
ncbi:MAG: HlyD family efflux transporter periplasmic adaptor subunit [Anaerolineae bacterium]|nr:HlyD family efflux transporter periplasmic adaptor subunit [Anaerolineae bacterium]